MYLLDANVFISAKNAHYGLDFVPAFWQWLEASHAAGRVFTVAAVGGEIGAGGDELATWSKAQPGSFYLAPNASTMQSLQATSQWASSQRFQQAAVNEFLRAGDYYLVAQAHATGYTVVTHEKSAPQAMKKIKIPQACAALGVPCITPWQMLRFEQARFVLP
jgi:hypothetical protein